MITRETDYSMRLMVALAERYEKGIALASSADVAKEMDIPYRFLRKLVHRLVVEDLIVSRRGKGGGVALTRKPSDITLLDILTATGPKGIELSPCVADPAGCRRSSICRFHKEFGRIQADIGRRLKAVRLSDLIEKTSK